MSSLTQETKGEIAAWSGELLDQSCPECEEQYMEIVKFHEVSMSPSGEKDITEHVGLMCINPECQEEYLDETISTEGRNFITIEKAKRNLIKTKREAVYEYAGNAVEKRNEFVNVKYQDLEPVKSFHKSWGASPVQAFRSGSLIAAGTFALVSIIWLLIIGLAFVIELLFDWSFAASVVNSTGSGFLYLLIFVTFIGIISGILVARNDQFNTIQVNPSILQFENKQIDHNSPTRPYIIVNNDMNKIELIGLLGESNITYTPEDLELTPTEFNEIIKALNTQEVLYLRNEDITEEDQLIEIEQTQNDEEFFYDVYSAKLRMELFATLGFVDRYRQMASKQFDQVDKPAQSAAPLSTGATEDTMSVESDFAEEITIDYEDGKSIGTVNIITKEAVLADQDVSMLHTEDGFYLSFRKAVDSDNVSISIGSNPSEKTTKQFTTPENLSLARKIRVRIKFSDYSIDTVTFNGRQLDQVDNSEQDSS